MVLSASIDLDKAKIERVVQSLKQAQKPIEILDRKLLKPDPEIERAVHLNPLLL